MLFILVIPFVGIVVLNGLTYSLSCIVLFKIETAQSAPQSYPALSEGFVDVHPPVIRQLDYTNLLSEQNEPITLSRFESSWTSIIDTLEKIQRSINDLRRLVETLHQMTQTFIAVINELSLWIDKVTIDPSVLRSI